MKRILTVLLAALMLGCSTMHEADPAALILGEWKIQSIGEIPVADNSPAGIQFQQDGKLGGNASCNRFFGQYELDGNKLMIDERMGATKMMCADQALMDQEDRLFRILPGARTFSVENDVLIVMDRDGKQVLEANRAP